MLEGLEAIEVNLSECLSVIDFRIDSVTYKKDFLRTEQLLEVKNAFTIESAALSVQNFGAYSLCNLINFSDSGLPFLMAQNIRENFIDWGFTKLIDKDVHDILWKSHCKKNQVLVTMAGYVGRTAVYDRDDIISSNQAIAKITLKNESDAYFISTFLNSKYGKHQIDRFQTATAQPNINMSLIKELKIPKVSQKLIEEITQWALFSEKKRAESSQKYEQAETLLLETLGMADFTPSSEAVNIKSFKDSFGVSGRLDAEYYQPKYEQVIRQIKQLPWQSLDCFIDNYSTGYPYKSEDYIENSELSLIRINNIKKGFLDISNVAFLPDIQRYLSEKDIANENDLLISMSGTIGNTCVVPVGVTAVVNQRIMRLTIKNYNPLVLMLIINSIVGVSQLERIGTGGVQTNISNGDISQMIIPALDMGTQKQIADLVQQSFVLKSQSTHLLDVAKRAVEIAIEQDETVALTYITSHTQDG